MSQAFVGEIKTLGFNFAPRGFALCAGQTLSIQQNAALFALLGTFYGGNGISTFQLPDLQGRVAVGQGQGAGLQLYQIGEKAGAETTTLTIANLPVHNHQATYTAPTFTAPTFTPPTAATTINAFTAPTARQNPPTGALLTTGQDTVSTAVVSNYSTAGNPVTLGTGAATTTLTGGGVSGGGLTGGGVVIGTTGSSIPFNSLQPYLTINYAIATVGIFPSRS